MYKPVYMISVQVGVATYFSHTHTLPPSHCFEKTIHYRKHILLSFAKTLIVPPLRNSTLLRLICRSTFLLSVCLSLALLSIPIPIGLRSQYVLWHQDREENGRTSSTTIKTSRQSLRMYQIIYRFFITSFS